MKKHFLSTFCCLALISAGLTTTTSCSKKEEVFAPSETPIGVKVVNGRVVFADDAAFKKVSDQLWQKSSSDLDKWERNIGFSSLRAKANLKDAGSMKLMEGFGFPWSYATLINGNGEYQIGTKIYWFNDGFKHETTSEEELKKVKANPSSSLVKYEAGSSPGKPISPTAISVHSNPAIAIPNLEFQHGDGVSLRTASGSLYGNGAADSRYTYNFFYKPANQYTSGNYRIVYETSNYTEDRGPGYYYTALNLRMKLEFEAAGGGWYDAGERRDFYYNLDIYANARLDGFSSSRVDVHNTLVQNPALDVAFYRTNNLQVEMGNANIYYDGNCYLCHPSKNRVFWNYDVYGSLNSTLPSPNGPAITYGVSATSPNMIW